MCYIFPHTLVLTILKEAAACSSNPTSPTSLKYFPAQIPSSSGDKMSSETADSSSTLDEILYALTSRYEAPCDHNHTNSELMCFLSTCKSSIWEIIQIMELRTLSFNFMLLFINFYKQQITSNDNNKHQVALLGRRHSQWGDSDSPPAYWGTPLLGQHCGPDSGRLRRGCLSQSVSQPCFVARWDEGLESSGNLWQSCNIK